jgi:hypothetical protein
MLFSLLGSQRFRRIDGSRVHRGDQAGDHRVAEHKRGCRARQLRRPLMEGQQSRAAGLRLSLKRYLERRPSSLELVMLDDRLAVAARREGFMLIELPPTE